MNVCFEIFSELGPKASTAPVRRTPQQQSYGMSTSPAQGQKVAELSRTIEHQLAVSIIQLIISLYMKEYLRGDEFGIFNKIVNIN